MESNLNRRVSVTNVASNVDRERARYTSPGKVHAEDMGHKRCDLVVIVE